MTGTPLSIHPVHLGLGATAEKEPAFTGELSWYEGYVERHGEDGKEARLLSMYSFNEPWDVWEMHPHGAEVVLCTAGVMTLVQEQADGSEKCTTLEPGQYAINAPGVWHTADIEEGATVIFITAGMGTEHRPRSR